MSMFGWVSNKSKIWHKMVILSHPRYGDFCGFRLLFNSSLKGPYLDNEERSLHKTWSVCYWSPMSMFGWVSNKSKIWPKMVILSHPRYGDFCGFRLLFNSSLKGSYLENEVRSLHQTWSVCYWSPMLMFAWVSNKSKIWPKMVILSHPRYGDFYCFLTPPSQGRLSRTKNDLLTKLGQCATEAPSQCLLEFQKNPKFHPKWWFCPTRGMANFTDFACFLTPPTKGRISRTMRDLSTKLGQCATEPPCQCLLEFQTNPRFDPKWWFCPTRYGDFSWFRMLFNSSHKRPYLDNEERSLHQTWSVCYWSPMSMLLKFQTHPKFDPKWWFSPTCGMAIFTAF